MKVKKEVSGAHVILIVSSTIIQLLIFSMFIQTICISTLRQQILAETNSVSIMPPIKGMTLNAWSAEAYNSSDFDQSILNLANIEANWVTFTVFWFMGNHTDTEMHPRPDKYTASDSSLIHAIRKAHELGMKVALKPMVDLVDWDGHWRGDIQPSNWTLWFENYRNFITYYADLAQAKNVSLFTVGTELTSSQPYESEWREIISDVDSRFNGSITYAANWDAYRTSHVKFWDVLDYVGVDAYFPLTNSYNPTVEQLISAWSYSTAVGWMDWTGRNWTNELYLTYTQTGKRIIFTEIGYVSQNGTNTQPWTHLFPRGSPEQIDLQEQADCYQAALEVLKDKAWFAGWFWWNWETDPLAGSPGTPDYNWYPPQNKPAQNVLRQYYGNPPDIAVTNVVCSKTVIGMGYNVSIYITMENQGAFDETFNVTIYANAANIATYTNITLTSGNFTTLTFTWNTTEYAKGNYTVSAYASPVLGEIDTGDNLFIDCMVRVTVIGDVAEPFGIVNILDILKVAVHFGTGIGEPNYNSNADVDCNNIINILDILVIAIHFGETCP